MIVRWQFGGSYANEKALNLSVRLMQRLLPEAELHVTAQRPVSPIPGVVYHSQPNVYSRGRFMPESFDLGQHQLFLENDHIMWALPEGLKRWMARDDATLAWIVDWDYYAEEYVQRVGDFRACPGMFGLPPGLTIPAHTHEGEGYDMLEQGYVAAWLHEHPPHEIVTHDEVSAYMPDNSAIGANHAKVGTCGVHLPGLNRGWSRSGQILLDELERKWL